MASMAFGLVFAYLTIVTGRWLFGRSELCETAAGMIKLWRPAEAFKTRNISLQSRAGSYSFRHIFREGEPLPEMAAVPDRNYEAESQLDGVETQSVILLQPDSGNPLPILVLLIASQKTNATSTTIKVYSTKP